MLSLLQTVLRTSIAELRTHRDLALENLALRQQLVVLRRSVKRPRLQPSDRLFWSLLKRFWRPWRETMFIVKPDTVVRWHRAGFRGYWTWRSHRRRPGRPAIDPQIRSLVRRMSEANPLRDRPGRIRSWNG